MPMLRLWAGVPSTSRSSTSTAPESGRSNPAAMRSAVVLPQPDGPSRLTNSPGSIARPNDSRAVLPANVLRIWRNSRVEGTGRLFLAQIPTRRCWCAAATGDERDDREQDGAGDDGQQPEAVARRRARTAPSTCVNTGRVIRLGNENPSIDAIVNSAKHDGGREERALSRATRMLGTMTRNDRGRPAGAERTRGVDERPQVDGPQPGVERSVRERHGEHRVERDEDEPAVEEPRQRVLVRRRSPRRRVRSVAPCREAG